MNALFDNYLNRLTKLHEEIATAIDPLPQEALDWSPGPEMNSIGVLVVHLAGAERYWIGDVACGDPSGRVREAEFRAHGLDSPALKKILDGGLTYTSGALEKLTLQDLEARRFAPRDNASFSVAWALLHALEHTAIHLGQIQLTRQLWDQREGPKGV
jgi:uncharacterized damage-inducible protein DinB